MSNVGQSDPFLFLVFCTAFGIAFLFRLLAPAVQNTSLKYERTEECTYLPVKTTTYRQKPIYKEKIVYRDKPVYKEKIVYREKPVQRKNPSKSTPRPEIKTDSNIIKDVVAGLKNLGFDSKTAKSLIKGICRIKKYTSSEDLMKDCLSKI